MFDDEDDDPQGGATDENTQTAAQEPAGAPQGSGAGAGTGAEPKPPAALQGPEAYAWDSWDGESWDHVPESSREWARAAAGRRVTLVQGKLDAELKAARDEAAKWKAWFLESGDDTEVDPRVAEAVAAKEASVKELEALKAQLTELQGGMEAERASWKQQQESWARVAQHSADRYAAWFEAEYKERLGTPAGQAAAGGMMKLLEIEPADGSMGIEPHQAFEIALLGEEALGQAERLLAKGMEGSDVLKLLQRAYTAPEPPKVKPRDSAALVADGSGGGGAEPPRPKAKKAATGDWLKDIIGDVARGLAR